MNCVSIDVSHGKSIIVVMRPFGEVVVSPFEVLHTDSELSKLAGLLKSLDGETSVVMESTGYHHTPVAWLLHDAGLYVSVVNAMLVHDYGNNSLKRDKTDKKDAVKLANCGLDHWLTLPRYVPEEDTRLMLKTCYRKYQQYSKVQTMLKNNLISLLDIAFPDANRLFHQKFCRIRFWNDTEVSTGRGINVQRLIFAEFIPVLSAPFMVLGGESLLRQVADALAMPKSGYKVHPLLAAIGAGRTGKQAVCVRESNV